MPSSPLPAAPRQREWSDPELNAVGSLAACVLVWAFLTMRLTEGGVPVPVPAKHLLFTYAAVVVLMVAALALVGALLAVRRERQGRGGEVERDERDAAIELRAERISGFVGLAGLNVLVVHAIGTVAFGGGAANLPAMPDSISGYVFALLSVGFAAHAAGQMATLWLYRR